MPHEASMYFGVIGNVRPAQPEGVIVTGMLLSKGGRCPKEREQKRRGRKLQSEFHFPAYPLIGGERVDVVTRLASKTGTCRAPAYANCLISFRDVDAALFAHLLEHNINRVDDLLIRIGFAIDDHLVLGFLGARNVRVMFFADYAVASA